MALHDEVQEGSGSRPLKRGFPGASPEVFHRDLGWFRHSVVEIFKKLDGGPKVPPAHFSGHRRPIVKSS